MSTLSLIEEAVATSINLASVRRCLVFSRTEDNVTTNEPLPRVLVNNVRELALALLDSDADRQSATMLGHVVVARRFGDVAVCAIGDGSMVEEEVQRKFNVLAIRLQVVASRRASEQPAVRGNSENPSTSSRAPASRRMTVPVMSAVQKVVREYAGPLGDLMVQRALEAVDMTDVPDDAAVQKVVETIAAQLPPHKRARFATDSRAAIIAANTPRR
jgi:hypothetical protein